MSSAAQAVGLPVLIRFQTSYEDSHSWTDDCCMTGKLSGRVRLLLLVGLDGAGQHNLRRRLHGWGEGSPTRWGRHLVDDARM